MSDVASKKNFYLYLFENADAIQRCFK